MQKPLKKKIACVIKEHGNLDRKKPKLRHKRRHSSDKRYKKRHQNKYHGGKCKKNFCNYHGLCYHDTDGCNFVQAHRKHVQPTHHIIEQQRLWQVQFVKDAKRCAKRHGLTGKEVKDLNTFVKDKINETIKEHNRDKHATSNSEDLSISSSNESIQCIISDTSDEELDSDSHKPAHKK
eukprot:8361508-Ditylum_brightwellii.AAC.1